MMALCQAETCLPEYILKPFTLIIHDLQTAKQTRERIFLYTENCDKTYLTYSDKVITLYQ